MTLSNFENFEFLFQIEEDCKKSNFDHLSIFRPGLLERGQDARFVERLYGKYRTRFFLKYHMK